MPLLDALATLSASHAAPLPHFRGFYLKFLLHISFFKKQNKTQLQIHTAAEETTLLTFKIHSSPFHVDYSTCRRGFILTTDALSNIHFLTFQIGLMNICRVSAETKASKGSPQDTSTTPRVSTLAAPQGAIDLFTCALLTASR